MLASEPALRAFVAERPDFRVVVADEGEGAAVMEYRGQGRWVKVATVAPQGWAALIARYDAATWSFGVYPGSAALPDSLACLPEELAFSYEADADKRLTKSFP